MSKKNSVKIENGMINFSCRKHLCQNSCCGPFSGISQELNNIDNRPFEEIVLTQEDYDRIYSAGYIELVEQSVSKQTGKKYFKMSLKADGTCCALSNGLCTINGIKPTLCQAFPFYFDMFSGLCAIDCEGFSDDYWTELSSCRYALVAAKKMYKFWLDFYSTEGLIENNESE